MESMEQPISPAPGPRRGRLKPLLAGLKKAIPFSAGILATLAGLFLYSRIFPPPAPLTRLDVSQTVAQAMASATPPPAFSERVYQEIMPSLVLIESTLPATNGNSSNVLGAGVVIDQSGDILTCLHVVAGATSIQLTFADGTQSTAQVVQKQPENDIAVLRANQPPTTIIPAVLGDPRSVQVGDEAYVVGNPFGLYSSMSAGVISGLNRSFRPPNTNLNLQGLIQIDAAVNPGNSGGPLLNRDGQVIGIVEGIVNPTQQDVFIGIGFAVPIDIAGGALGSPVD